MLENGVWETAGLHHNATAIGARYVRRVKPNGKYKTRLCGRGFNMVKGIDYTETFAPVAKMATLRIFLSLIAIFNLYSSSLDVKTAYLNAHIKEDVYMIPPDDLLPQLKLLFERSTNEDHKKIIKNQMRKINLGHVLKLLKAIYGTKQGGREWFLLIDEYFKSIGFKSNKVDNCFYTLIEGNDYVILLLYVDDIILAATTEELEQR